jgi:hypothetical protein
VPNLWSPLHLLGLVSTISRVRLLGDKQLERVLALEQMLVLVLEQVRVLEQDQVRPMSLVDWHNTCAKKEYAKQKSVSHLYSYCTTDIYFKAASIDHR